jgi:hypothetical protein
MLRSFWDRSIGKRNRKLRLQDEQRQSNDYARHMDAPSPPPGVHDRKITAQSSEQSEILDREQSHSCSPLKSRLLSLPAEIRLVVWEYALGGNIIAVYRAQDRRLRHVVLDDTNSWTPGEDFPIQARTIEDAVMRLPQSMRQHENYLSRSTRLQGFTLLQSSRSM